MTKYYPNATNITWGSGYSPQYQPSSIISARTKALVQIMGSRVVILDNNKNKLILSNYHIYAKAHTLNMHVPLSNGVIVADPGFLERGSYV